MVCVGIDIRVKDMSVEEAIALGASAALDSRDLARSPQPSLVLAVGEPSNLTTCGDLLNGIAKEFKIGTPRNERSDVPDASGKGPQSPSEDADEPATDAQLPKEDSTSTFVFWEIWQIGEPHHSASAVLDRHAGPIYGLLMGDEGWQGVPPQQIQSTLANTWSTRTYMAVLPQSTTLLTLNLRPARDQERKQAAKDLLRTIGHCKPHLLINPDEALPCFDHGGLCSYLRAVRRKLEIDEAVGQLDSAYTRRRYEQRSTARSPWRRIKPATKLTELPHSLYESMLRLPSANDVRELDRLDRICYDALNVRVYGDAVAREADVLDRQVRDDRTSTIHESIMIQTTWLVALTIIILFATIALIVVAILQH